MTKVLIIDDCAQSRTVAQARLKFENVEVVTADGGRAGLEAVRRENPDLVLLDVDMPDLSGFEVCRKLKADPEYMMIPVVFLSGSGDAEDKVRGLDLGAVDFVSKPFDAVELRARVRAALRTKRLQDLLIEHARIDPLTRLPNRRALMDRLDEEMSRLSRHGGTLSLIMADVDHFKKVNDTHGHMMGDQVLEQVASAIQSQCRRTDLAARYGGEEFVIVVPEVGLAGAEELAERCRLSVKSLKLPCRGDHICPTVSFGVAEAAAGLTKEDLLFLADSALYAAKQSGRDAVCTAGPQNCASRGTG